MAIILNGSTGITFPDGTTEAGRLLNVRIFTIANTGQNYTPTTGTRSVIVELVGGGGGGGGASSSSTFAGAAGGGGAGGYGVSRYTSGFSGSLLTIGAGGAGGAGGQGGGLGGATSFGTLLSATGGGGGSPGPASPSVSIFIPGTQGSCTGWNVKTGVSSAPYGGWIANNGWVGGPGMSSPLGSGGYRTTDSNNGVGGEGYGSGGAGAAVAPNQGARAGGNGAPGCIIVWEYA